jgi:hypothetical protein
MQGMNIEYHIRCSKYHTENEYAFYFFLEQRINSTCLCSLCERKTRSASPTLVSLLLPTEPERLCFMRNILPAIKIEIVQTINGMMMGLPRVICLFFHEAF